MRGRRRTVALVTLVAGCAMGPDYVRPPVPEPESYRETFPPGESVANVPWWEFFGDSVLVDLVTTGLENNRSLRSTVFLKIP